MDDLSLTELAVHIDDTITRRVAHIPNEHQTPVAQALSKCSDCNTEHIPRRLVVCVDSTWVEEDGAEGDSENHPSNGFWIWLAVKKGVVKGKDGKLWDQELVKGT
ncbi:hypothetical protein EDB81DRAFT_795723 [Dactylonectria macrodidyma]|uniref:Uncharacterized protein n=1 Tax=Dactylonectria macrodidyma TaxID=307937 RepID=A0A9P9ET88_9HYPO|nr:hypothetical protein EDB81DRAFT_795723 [Dactylonectria macrodidyma]